MKDYYQQLNDLKTKIEQDISNLVRSAGGTVTFHDWDVDNHDYNLRELPSHVTTDYSATFRVEMAIGEISIGADGRMGLSMFELSEGESEDFTTTEALSTGELIELLYFLENHLKS